MVKRYNPPTRPRQLITLLPPMLYNRGMRKGDYYTLDDYVINRDGTIYSKKRGIVMKPQPNAKGYLRVVIGKKKYFVHRLVAEKFVPNPEQKAQVNHKNGDKTDNRAENLEWVTNAENRSHAVENGLQIQGEKCPWAKLTEQDVIEIRNSSELVKELAKRFNVSTTTISGIRNGRTWKSVEKIC